MHHGNLESNLDISKTDKQISKYLLISEKYRELTVLINADYDISFISLYIPFLLSHGLFWLVVLG